MSEALETLKAILRKKLTETEVQAFMAEFTLASGQGAVAISGDATGAVTVTGSHNIVGDNNSVVINQGTDPEELVTMLRRLLREMQPTDSTPEISPEELRLATLTFLQEIASKFKETRLFHTKQPIVLQDQYVPIQVTLEPHRRDVETLRGYWETEEELKRAYALKGGEEELKRQQMDWPEAKQKHQRLMVLADPGMGKSTLLRMEGGTTAEREGQRLERDSTALTDTLLPLFLRLSELAKDAGELLEAIPRLIGRDYPRTAPVILPLLTEKLKAGQCLLLLDALDEVPKDKRLELKEKLDRFVGNYPCSVICTSRIVGYDGNFLAGGQEAEIVPFREPQIKQYVTTWFTNAAGYLSDPSVSAAALLRELRSKPQVRGLVQNPLLLALICSLYQEQGLTLPARRVQVYEQAVEYMLEQWSQTQRSRFPGKAKAKTRLLEALAYHFSCEDREVFDRDDLYDWMENYLDTDAPRDLRAVGTEELIAELSEADGILQQLSPGSDQYLFLHRTFQEYLTASYLARAQDGIALAMAHVWKYDWHETISLMAGLMKQPLALLQAITDEPDDIFQTQLLLAGRCLSECEASSHSLVVEVIDRIYQFWLTYPSYEFIRSVVVIIGQNDSSLCEQLQTELSHEDSRIKWHAVEVLGRIGSDKTINVLIQALNHKDTSLRQSAAGALGQSGSDKAIDALIQALNHKGNSLRWSALDALGQIGSDRAINALILALKDEDCSVRARVAGVLGQIDSDKAINALIPALRDKSSLVRLNAIEALEKTSKSAMDALICALNHEYRDVRINAAEILGRITSNKAVKVLIDSLNHEDDFVRRNSVAALGKTISTSAIDALISMLHNNENIVRRISTEALSWIDLDEAIDFLIYILNNEDNILIVGRATAALGQISNDKVVDALILALNHKDFFVRWNAVEALGQISSDKAIDALICALNHEDGGVRGGAANALGQIGNDKAVDALIITLSDEDRDVRENAAAALGQIGNDKAVDALIRVLNYEDRSVRGRAANALGQIGSDKAVDALILALNHEDDNIRENAAEALGKIGSSICLEKLIQSPQVDIYRYDIFFVARSLAIRFSKADLPFVPVYPERVMGKRAGGLD